jgi:hypothetical protein
MSQAQADAIHERYRKSFVGHARASRDLALLDGIIADTENLLPTLDGALRSSVADRLALYRNERGAIATIQAGGPAVLAGWRAVEWSELGFGRYRRHFAGKNRATRDLGLLLEMAAEERRNLAALPTDPSAGLAEQRDRVQANVKLFEAEVAAIPVARTQLSPAEQARVLATAANQQFDNWRRFFEGKPRLTRRPALLERMIDALETIRVRMGAVRDMGVNGEGHLSNITKVTDRIAHFRGELEKIRAARVQASGLDIARRLGDDANAVFRAYREAYAGKPRAEADLDKLSALCDDLQEVARAMRALDDERPVEQNTKNIGVVLDHLKMMEREWTAISEAKGQKK